MQTARRNITALLKKTLAAAYARLPAHRQTHLLTLLWQAADQAMSPVQSWQLRKKFFDNFFTSWPVLASNMQMRIYGFFDLLAGLADVPGDIVECGVGRGHSLATIVYAVALLRLDKRVYGFDSFAGFPNASTHDLGPRVTSLDRPPGWADTSMDMIETVFATDRAHLDSLLLKNNVSPVLVPGFFEETLPEHLPARIAFLHVDCDLYESTRVVLEACLPRMSANGILIFDEYHDPRWPGVKKTVDECCVAHGLTVQFFDRLQRYGVRFALPSAAEG